jgi:hypothetical protein
MLVDKRAVVSLSLKRVTRREFFPEVAAVPSSPYAPRNLGHVALGFDGRSKRGNPNEKAASEAGRPCHTPHRGSGAARKRYPVGAVCGG